MEKVIKPEVSAEVHFAQKLAANEKKIRDRALKRLQKYLYAKGLQGGFSDEDLLKIWKGLHYCMWMQDKPLVQEELSRRISQLVHAFPSASHALSFVKAFLQTEAREWNLIDKLRLDKFMMMVREILHETLSVLSKVEWDINECARFSGHVTQCVMRHEDSALPDGLRLHLADIFVEELKKVNLEHLDTQKLLVLLKPFIQYIVYSNKMDLVKRIMADVVKEVINSMSERPKEKDGVGEKGEEEEEDSDSDEGEEDSDAEDEESMEVEEGAEGTEPAFKVNLPLLLMALFSVAERADVRQANRALVYNLVKAHPQIYSHIVQLRAEMQADVEDFLRDFGQAKDQRGERRKKKRGKKRKKIEEEEDGEVTESDITDAWSEQPSTPSTTTSTQTAVTNLSMSSEAKKKVNFDLRKNKHNKFTDYLKSIGSTPPPPVLPQSSPPHSILKVSSTTSMDMAMTSSSADGYGQRENKNPRKHRGFSADEKKTKKVSKKRRSLSPH